MYMKQMFIFYPLQYCMLPQRTQLFSFIPEDLGQCGDYRRHFANARWTSACVNESTNVEQLDRRIFAWRKNRENQVGAVSVVNYLGTDWVALRQGGWYVLGSGKGVLPNSIYPSANKEGDSG